jgi:putative RNA 2'-phosphotransferase
LEIRGTQVIDNNKLSKIISHALRHEPESYGLTLDNEGWVNINELLFALQKKKEWKGLSIDNIETMINLSSKKRHECLNGKIRALYGHSISQQIIKEKSIPPNLLYHGTLQNKVSRILNEGLKPMERQYVHLSIDMATATKVAERRKGEINILEIEALKAYNDGFSFYKEDNGIWLADFIPPKYIKI